MCECNFQQNLEPKITSNINLARLRAITCSVKRTKTQQQNIRNSTHLGWSSNEIRCPTSIIYEKLKKVNK